MNDPADTASRLHATEAEVARLRAIVESIPAIKANVRDACSVACAVVRQETARDNRPEVRCRSRGAAECVDAIAAIDLGPL